MRPPVSLTSLLLTAGACLAAYGGYGAGVARAAQAGPSYWLQVVAAFAAGVGLFALGLWRARRPAAAPNGSLADDLAALERLVPTVRNHPDGLSSLQDLIDVLFEARHRPESVRKPESVRTPEAIAERAAKEGRSHA